MITVCALYIRWLSLLSLFQYFTFVQFANLKMLKLFQPDFIKRYKWKSQIQLCQFYTLIAYHDETMLSNNFSNWHGKISYLHHVIPLSLTSAIRNTWRIFHRFSTKVSGETFFVKDEAWFFFNRIQFLQLNIVKY